MGYTIIRSKLAGIECCTRYFVPLGKNLEIWELTLTNHREEAANCLCFQPWNSVSGMLWMTPPTSSAITPLAKWKS